MFMSAITNIILVVMPLLIPLQCVSIVWHRRISQSTARRRHSMLVVVICDPPTLASSSFHAQGQVTATVVSPFMVPSCRILCHTTCGQLTYLWPLSEIDIKHSFWHWHVVAHLRPWRIWAIQVTLLLLLLMWVMSYPIPLLCNSFNKPLLCYVTPILRFYHPMNNTTAQKADITESKLPRNRVNKTTGLSTFASAAGGSCGIGVLLQTLQ